MKSKSKQYKKNKYKKKKKVDKKPKYDYCYVDVEFKRIAGSF